ncbi:LamG-like jellyroll fold domain-containing protein, partial [Vibrio anguillarum]
HYKWLISLLLMSGGVCAQQYNLSNNQYPPCNTSWQKSGNSYTCSGNGQVTLNDGDVIVADVDSTLIANDGFYLINNQVGNASNRISLQANYGAIASQGSQNTIYGDVSANSSNVTFNNTNLIGNVTTGGNVTINGGSVQGNLTSNDRTVVITGANVVGNITAQSGIVITGSVYSGNITMTSNNSVTFNSVDMTSGSVSGASHFTANNSQLGRPDSQVSISTTSNDITLNDSTAYGDFNAAINNAGGQVNVNNSSITGTCSPISNPLNACDPSPVARYHFDEVQWSGAFNEVKNAFGSSLHGRAMNGALTSSQSPALPANINNYGTCGYGEFVANQNQYVQVAHDSQLSFSDQLTISAWVYPVSRPANGGLHTIVAKDTNYEFHLDSQGRVFWYWERSSGGANTLTTSNVIPLNTWTHITIRYNRSASSNERQKIYINGVVAATNSDNQPLKTNTVNLEIGRDYNSDNRTFSGRLDEVAIYNQALTDSQIVNLYNERHLCQSSGLQCFSDDFQSQPLDEQWRVFSSSGNFTPSITNNRMRLTQAVQNQATASTFQRIFPAAGNRVEVEFDYFAYGGNGADGVAIVFSDASVTPQVGAFGGPLGFGYKVNEQKPGFAGGWLGIGLDEYGNYSIEGGGNGPGRRRQAVVLRGSGSGYSGYNYLAGTCNNGTTNTNGDCLNPRVDNTNGNPQHRYRIVIDSTQASTSLVTVSRKVGTDSWKTLIGPVDVMSFAAQQNVPTDLFMSITGSTGSSTNNHEIDNFEVCALNSRPVGEQINHFRISLPAQGLTCAASDVSVTACADENCNNLFTDPVIAYLVPNSLPSATGGWVNGSTISFSNGVGNAQLRRNSAGNVTVDVSGSVPTAMSFNNTLCSHNGNAGPFLASNCTMNFADSGFILDVPNSYANQSVTG